MDFPFPCQRDTLLLSETLRFTISELKWKGIDFQKSCHPVSLSAQCLVEACTPQSG